MLVQVHEASCVLKDRLEEIGAFHFVASVTQTGGHTIRRALHIIFLPPGVASS
jgi:hypothetical protein